MACYFDTTHIGRYKTSFPNKELKKYLNNNMLYTVVIPIGVFVYFMYKIKLWK